MKLLTSLAGGLAGALTVTLLHELIRKVDSSAPRLDKLGEQATTKLLKATGLPVPAKDDLYAASMISDIIGNTIYYSLAGTRMNKATSTGGFLGLGAGLGALKMPQYLNLRKDYTNSTSKRRIITVGLYLTGGLVAAGVMRWLERRKQQRPWKTDHLVATTKSPNEAYKPVLDITV